MEWRYEYLDFHEQKRTSSQELYSDAQAYLDRLETPKSRQSSSSGNGRKSNIRKPLREVYTPEPFAKAPTFLSEIEGGTTTSSSTSGLFSDMEDDVTWQSFYTRTDQQKQACKSCSPRRKEATRRSNESFSEETSSYSIQETVQSAMMVDLQEAKQVVHDVTVMVLGCMQNMKCNTSSRQKQQQRLATTTMTTGENEIQQRWREQMNDIARIKELQQQQKRAQAMQLEGNQNQYHHDDMPAKTTMLKRTRAFDLHGRR